MNFIPAFYYPTTIILLDDDKSALEGNTLLFEKDYHVICFERVRHLLDYLDKYKQRINSGVFIDEVDWLDNTNIQNASVTLKIDRILDLKNDKLKENDISLLVTDYKMPEVDGLSVCETLKKYPFEKSLLTVDSDYQLAVEALRIGKIGYYSNKLNDSPNVLIKGIKELALKYFMKLTSNLMLCLQGVYDMPQFDSNYYDYFNNLVKSKNIKEYYMIDTNGSYLLVNQHGQEFVLVVQSEYYLNNFIEICKEQKIDSSSINKIINRESLPFYGVKKAILDINLNNINEYLVNCQQIKHTPYFASLISK